MRLSFIVCLYVFLLVAKNFYFHHNNIFGMHSDVVKILQTRIEPVGEPYREVCQSP